MADGIEYVASVGGLRMNLRRSGKVSEPIWGELLLERVIDEQIRRGETDFVAGQGVDADELRRQLAARVERETRG